MPVRGDEERLRWTSATDLTLSLQVKKGQPHHTRAGGPLALVNFPSSEKSGDLLVLVNLGAHSYSYSYILKPSAKVAPRAATLA